MIFTHCLAFAIPILIIIMNLEEPEKAKTMPTPPKSFLCSPDSSISAGIYHADNKELLNGDEFYLGIRRDSVEIIITRELSDGFGTYEAGIMGLEWLNENRIRIARIISDQPDTLIYNVNNMRWE